MSDDPRVPAVLGILGDVLSISLQASNLDGPSSTCLSKFLNEGTVVNLMAYANSEDSSAVVSLANDWSSENKADNVSCVHLFKTVQDVLPGVKKGLHRVLMVNSIPAGQSHVSSLLLALQQTFAPHILSQERNQPLQKTLARLEQELKHMVMHQDHNSVREHDPTGIHSLDDEYLYWNDLTRARGAAAERATAFAKLSSQLATMFAPSTLRDNPFDDMLRTMADAQDVLTDLWAAFQSEKPYPQPRMENVLRLIGFAVVGAIKAKLTRQGIFGSEFSAMVEAAQAAVRAADEWSVIVNQLTSIDWAQRWKGKPKEHDEGLLLLRHRVSEIVACRTLHQELTRLLSEEDAARFGMAHAFTAFDQVHVLHYGPYSEPQWKEAVREFHRLLEPVERFAAQILRQRIFSLADKPSLLLGEFRSFPELLLRRTISEELGSERESLLGQLVAHLEEIRHQFDTQSNAESKEDPNSPPMGKNLSSTVNRMMWAHTLLHRVDQTESIVTKALPGVAGMDAFTGLASRLKQTIDEYKKDLFQEWEHNTLDALADDQDPIVLQMKGKLMDLDLDGDGQLKVHYSERLVTLLRETRQLSEMGYSSRIPSSITKVVETGEKYYRYALKLKQVANFYNSISEQIIPAQMGMLLTEAQRFEQIVLGHQGATWDRPSECDAYMSQLMAAAEALTSRNRKLRSLHAHISQEVVGLLSMSLLKHRDAWTARIDSLRAVFSKEERSHAPQAMLGWKTHWDHQLFKAFEMQYRLCLETLSSALPEIQVELVLQRKRLALKPPLEDVRMRYYRNLKQFLGLPAKVKGFTDNNQQLFHKILARNAKGLFSCYANAELLFRELQGLVEEYAPWVVLASVDVESYLESRLCFVEDWESNFKALKQRRREADRLIDNKRIGCLNISLQPMKRAVDDLMYAFSDALVLSLRSSANKDLKELVDYLDAAMSRLNTMPRTVEEMSEAKAAWKNIEEQRAGKQRLLEQIHRKNRLLADITSMPLDTDTVSRDWENFVIALEAFDDMLENQKDALKEGIIKRGQQVTIEADKFASKWQATKPSVEGKVITDTVAEETLLIMKDWQEGLVQLEEQAERVRQDYNHFDMEDAPDFPALDAVKLEIEVAKDAWALYGDFSKELATMTGESWVTFRVNLFALEDFVGNWSKTVKGKTAKHKRRDAIGEYMWQNIQIIKRVYPVLRKCTGELFETEHWKILFTKIGLSPKLHIKDLTLGHLLSRKEQLEQQAQAIEDLASRAQGEVTIREAVQELKVWSEETEFQLTEHVSNAGRNKARVVPLIKGWKDIFTALGDQQSLVQSLKESPYYKPFEDQCQLFEARIALLDECLHDMNQIQRKWVYLEPIFGRGALPQEQGRFQSVDQEFVGIMEDIKAVPNLIRLAGVQGLKDTVRVLLDQLERCQKALNEFLEDKRSTFPRFYFIGDDDLLEILGQAQNPAVIQNHLKKLFAGIHAVRFSADHGEITAMCSSQGEVVELTRPVAVTEDVEVWLQDLSAAMVHTLSSLLVECSRAVAATPTLSAAVIDRFPSQVLCVAELVAFTGKMEAAIAGTLAIDTLAAELTGKLAAYTSTQATSPLADLKSKALVLDLIHNIEVLHLVKDHRVKQTSHWLWQKQLRFYLNSKGACIVRMCDAQFDYTYEYQGNAGKLVHTPLTDKCYLVLTQGMHLGYGGNPYGPAGTGKTESVKALGNALGRQVLVFNCDEGIDFQSMGRIFTGLVKSGAWGCFDEFNRLKEDQLSAVSQQIQVIQAALKNRSASCSLLGSEIDVNANAAIFVTMNPASKEYGGRSKLPHNLKMLFRSVAMSVPDISLIAEVILYSEGFQFAHEVGRKIVEVYSLAKQLLSQQKHYDWGLRAMKTVLRHGGQLIHADKKVGDVVIDIHREAQLLIGALRINTLSKLTYQDSLRFQGLIKDVFPQSLDEPIEYKELTQAIKESLSEMGLQVVPSQIHKVLQLSEALNQRMGVVVVGPSGCGKTVLWNVLARALKKLGTSLVQNVMNPKALNRQELLGHMDHDTREWSDGVLTASARQVVKEPLDVHSWIVCDGDIDPEWIESLNSVLDDNRLLTLPNGERIQFGSNVNFLFESHDLQHASPATISRMGMIFLSQEDVDARSMTQSWVATQEEKMRNKLTSWMDELFFQSLDAVMALQPRFVVATTRTGIVSTALSHLRAELVTSRGEFICGLIRGMGSNLVLKDRQQFATRVFQWAGEQPPPGASSPLDCYYSRKDSSFKAYASERAFDRMLHAGDMRITAPPMVQTASVMRNQALIDPWLDALEPFILVGPEGCGKTLLVRHCIGKLKGATVATLHCSAQTQASHVIQKLYDACGIFSTNKGRVLRPKEGDRVVLFLKDLNLPTPDKYDTIQVISFVQQLVTYQGFYDANLDWVSIERVQLVATMNPATTVGRHELSTRFTAKVNVAYLEYPNKQQMQLIYSVFLRGVVEVSGVANADTKWRSNANIEALAGAVVTIFEDMKKKFSVDDYRHYLFNPRDVTEWVFGVLRYDLSAQGLLPVISYEAHRLFYDRLVTRDHRRSFIRILGKALKGQFQFDIGSESEKGTFFSSLHVVGGTQQQQQQEQQQQDQQDETQEDNDKEKKDVSLGRILEPIPMEELRTMIKEGLVGYERVSRRLDMLLLPQELAFVAYQDRVLSRPGGSLLLVGSSGVGRANSITLVCHMHRIALFTPHMGLNYGEREFRADMKELVKQTGIEGRETLLFIEDHQLTHPSFLEMVNSLLSAGEIPGLFSPKELDPLLAPLKERFAAEGVGRFRNLYDYFLYRVRQCLHIVLSMDPSHPQFALRCESNPAIYTQCTVMWMGTWGSDTLYEVPRLRLGRILNDQVSIAQRLAAGKHHHQSNGQGDGEEDEDEDEDGALNQSVELADEAKLMLEKVVHIHSSMQSKSDAATPKKYESFLSTYLRVYEQNQIVILTEQRHLSAGLSKLNEAAATVDELGGKARATAKQVKIKQAEADDAMVQIQDRMGKAEERKVEARQLKITLGEEEVKLNSRKKQVEDELSDVQPLLEKTRKAVNGIKKSSLNEIRAFAMPPPAIRDVIAGVLLLMGEFDHSWGAMKKFLSSPSVKDNILTFDARVVTAQLRNKVLQHIRDSGDSFEHERISHVSRAAAPLAAWVKANVKYSAVLENVQPLENELAEATHSLAHSQARMTALNDELAAIDVEVDELRKTFARKTGEAESLKIQLRSAEERLAAASSLIGKLGDEKGRWAVKLKDLSTELSTLPAAALMASGIITYLGPFPEDVRTDAIRNWAAKCAVPDAFDFLRFMCTESDLLRWKGQGLPSDDLSMQNALVIMNSVQCPFIIDPNSQATGWLRQHLSAAQDQGLEVVQQQDPRFVLQLELAVRFGKILIVQEAEGVLPILYPILRKELYRQGPRWVVHVGQKTIDYNDNFRLFFVTREPTPTIPASAASLITEVNFTVTRSGLEGQLLGVTLNHEKPDLEMRKSALLAEQDGLKIELASLEKRLLEALAASEGDLLQNKELIENLNQTKTQSTAISEKLAGAKVIQSDLDRQREVYRPVAHIGSALYFLIDQLDQVSNMYSFSLPSFNVLFRNNLRAGGNAGGNGNGNPRMQRLASLHSLYQQQDDEDKQQQQQQQKKEETMTPKQTEQRIAQLEQSLKHYVFAFITRSLFKADRLMFALHMVHCLYPHLYGAGEWQFFTGELVAAKGDKAHQKVALPSWAAPDRKKDYRSFAAAFPQLFRQLGFEENATQWSKWVTHPQSEVAFPQLPTTTSSFQRLLVIKVLRPERLHSAMTNYCLEALSLSTLAPPTMQLGKIRAMSSPSEPVLFVTTPGADPSQELEEFAVGAVGAERFQQLAMGQGQTDPAIEALRQAARTGGWLMLKNLHLVTWWLPHLEKEIKALSVDADPSFRLWLTAEPHPEFSPILLQQSLKITYEAPPGLKQNLIRTYESWGPAFVQKGSPFRARVLFVLAWFHAIVQERRVYVPQGWTKAYEFSFADLRSGADIIDSICTQGRASSSELPWDTIWGLLENAIYGGRIDNDNDIRVLVTYLKQFFNADVLDCRSTVARGLQLPESADMAAYMQLIQALPDTDDAATFSLPANISGSVQRTQSTYIVQQLRKLAAAASLTSRFDRVTWLQLLSPILTMWQKMTGAGSNLLQAPPAAGSTVREQEGKEERPTQSFVTAELQRLSDIVAVVDHSLSSLSAVLSGAGLLTPDIMEDATSLLAGNVPLRWNKFWWGGPDEPALWMQEVAYRKQSILAVWTDRVASGQLFGSAPVNLSQLLNPRTFLNALRQETARKRNLPIDSLKLTCAWNPQLLPGESSQAQLGVEKLLVQGCSFTNGQLASLAADAPSLSILPPCVFAYIEKKEAEPYKDNNCIEVPLYFSTTREDQVCSLRLPCKGGKEGWVLNGVAVFLTDMK